jgi:flagellar hook-associated protein 3 FlgL
VLIDKLISNYTNAALMLTEFGADMNYLTITRERLKDEWINLAERQQQLEKIEPAEAFTQEKMMEFMFNAALQMGSKVLQPSLFHFLR